MNLFATKMTAVDDSRVTTCERVKTSWNVGLKGVVKLKPCSAERRAIASGVHKGKIESEQTKAKKKASALLRGELQRQQRLQRLVMTYYGVFTVEQVLTMSGYQMQTLNLWLKKYPQHYYYIKDTK